MPSAAKLLEQVNALLDQYNETLADFFKHKNSPSHTKDAAHLHHLIHQLRGDLIHLENLKKQGAAKKTEDTANFLEHHLNAVSHATDHWYHIHHQLDEYDEEMEELQEIYEHILALLNELADEEKEALALEENNAEAPNPLHSEKHRD